MCQLLFAVYMSVLAIMDIKWKKLSLSVLLSGFIHFASRTFMRERYPYDSTGSRRGRRNCFSGIVSRVTDEAFGYGDSILILIMGGFLGFWNILSLLVAAFSMAALFSIFMLIRKKFHRKSAFPFVPFLTAAYIGGMIIGAY